MWGRKKRVPRARFSQLATAEELDCLIGQSRARPVVVYLHDPYCPLNSMAIRRVESVDWEVALVDVSVSHDLKRAIESMTGVRHASPQVIVLRDGKATWHASHRSITTEAIERALDAAQPGR